MWKTAGFWYIQQLIEKIIEQLTICLTQDDYKILTYQKITNQMQGFDEDLR